MSDAYGNWQKYQNPNPVQRWLLARFLARVDALVRSVNPSTILDVGCAEGYVADRLRQLETDVQVLGLDLDHEALLRGRELGARGTCRGSVYHLPYPANAFDLVLALEVLEHLKEPGRALDELCRVAQRYCLLSVPHEPFFRGGNFLRGKHFRQWGNDPGHLNHWSYRGFLNLVEECGTVQQASMPFPWSIALIECDAAL